MEIPNEIDPLFHKQWDDLLAKSAELGLSKESLFEPTPQTFDEDGADVSAQRQAKEMMAVFLDASGNVRKLVEWAIQRLLNDRYGICCACGNQIPDKRLLAIPWTPFCRECQDLAEQGGLEGSWPVMPAKLRNPTKKVKRAGRNGHIPKH